MIEDEGYDACLQRNVPGMRIKGDKTTNPEVKGTYELQFASPVEDGKTVDYRIEYPTDFMQQHLEYGKKYATLEPTR